MTQSSIFTMIESFLETIYTFLLKYTLSNSSLLDIIPADTRDGMRHGTYPLEVLRQTQGYKNKLLNGLWRAAQRGV